MQIPQSDIFRLSFGKSDSLFDISTHPKTGKTMLTYYTDNPDCEHDWFEIDETVEDAKQTIKKAKRLLQEEREKYEKFPDSFDVIVMVIRKILMKV